MADSKNPGFDADEIGTNLSKAKSSGNQISYAFGLGSKPGQSALLTDPRKSPSALKTQLRALKMKFSKVCVGTFTVADGEMRLQSEKPAKGMVKALRLQFRTEGLIGKYKPALVGPDGVEIDEDSLSDADEAPEDSDEGQSAPVDAPEAPSVVTPEPQTGPDPALEAVKRRLVAVQGKLAGLPQDMADKLRQACVIAVQQIRQPDAAAAAQSLDRIEAALARAAAPQSETPTEPPKTPDPLAKLQDALGKLAQRIKALSDEAARARLGGQARDIMGWIRDGSVEQAVSGIRMLSLDLASAEKANVGAKAMAGNPLEIWRDAKDICDKDISALQSALRQHDDPDLTRIADLGLYGLTDGVQVRLMAAMIDFGETSGEARVKAAKTLAQRAAECRKLIENDPVIALAEGNPFGIAVAIRAPLGAALDKLDSIARAA